MSPLALMKEGETAEIVVHYSRDGHEHKNKDHPEHDQATLSSCAPKQCSGRCENCGCGNSTTGDHLMNMGLRPGKRVEMITNSGSGPLVLMVDESRIAMGRGEAMKIYVRRNEE